MFTNFKELEAYVLSHKNKKRIVLANAHDEPALSAVVNAHRRGVVDGTLLGKKDEILALLREMNEDPAEYEIVDFDGPELDAAKAPLSGQFAINANRQGHYESDFRINGANVRAMIDTGATLVAINEVLRTKAQCRTRCIHRHVSAANDCDGFAFLDGRSAL